MLAYAVVLAACIVQPRTADAGIPPASGEQTATVGGQSFTVFTFRPSGCAITGVLVVLHGVDRNPDAYRDQAIPVAQRDCLLAVAPLFERQEFPNWRYQLGGVVHDGRLQAEADWTPGFLPGLAAWARAQGATRIERGRTVFAEAEQTARAHAWPFNWRVLIVSGVGHGARLMLD